MKHLKNHPINEAKVNEFSAKQLKSVELDFSDDKAIGKLFDGAMKTLAKDGFVIRIGAGMGATHLEDLLDWNEKDIKEMKKKSPEGFKKFKKFYDAWGKANDWD
jgi:tRNA A22 N-methylase